MQATFSHKLYVQLSKEEFDIKLNQNMLVCVSGEERKTRDKMMLSLWNNMSIKTFEQFCKDNSDYFAKHKINTYVTVLQLAARKACLPVMQHIIDKDKECVNLRPESGATALIYVTYSLFWKIISPKAAVHAAEILIAANAHVNSICRRRMSAVTPSEPGTTALALAAEQIENLPFIQFLILHGGVIYDPLPDSQKDYSEQILPSPNKQKHIEQILPSPNKQEHIEKVLQSLFKKAKILLIANCHLDNVWQVFPKEILQRLVREGCQCIY